MKIRKSFVTNSSSSSYIIAVKEKDGKISKEFEEKLLEWAKMQILESGTTKISTIEDLNQFILDKYGYRKDTIEDLLKEDYILEEYNEIKEKLNKGFVIYEKYISCEGQDEHLDMFDDALRILSSSSDFEGIKTDLGY